MGPRPSLLLLVLALLAAPLGAAEVLTVQPGAVDTRPVALQLESLPEDEVVEGVRLLGARGASWTGRVLSVARDQLVQDGPTTRRATVVLCSFADIGLPALRPSLDVTPVLDLAHAEGQTGRRRSVVARGAFALGRPAAATAWALLLLLGALLTLARLTADRRLARPGLLGLVCGVDGRLSLSRSQVALVSLAVGGLVLRDMLYRSDLPDVPPGLLALMAVSLATLGISHVRTRREGGDPNGAPARPARLADLITVEQQGRPRLSLGRAQLVFWTLLTVGLLTLRSLADDALWDLPAGLVTLFGLGCLAYLGGTFAPPRQLVYPPVPRLRVDRPMTPVAPSLGEGVVSSFSITPALPPGLVLDPGTGVLSGTPRAKAPAEVYTVVAHGTTGSASASLELRVRKASGS